MIFLHFSGNAATAYRLGVQISNQLSNFLWMSMLFTKNNYGNQIVFDGFLQIMKGTF